MRDGNLLREETSLLRAFIVIYCYLSYTHTHVHTGTKVSSLKLEEGSKSKHIGLLAFFGFLSYLKIKVRETKTQHLFFHFYKLQDREMPVCKLLSHICQLILSVPMLFVWYPNSYLGMFPIVKQCLEVTGEPKFQKCNHIFLFLKLILHNHKINNKTDLNITNYICLVTAAGISIYFINFTRSLSSHRKKVTWNSAYNPKSLTIQLCHGVNSQFQSS